MRKIARGRDRGRPRRIVLKVLRHPGRPSRALVRFGRVTLPAAIGRGGMTAFKREGDGATPRADLAVVGGFFRGGAGRSFPAALPLSRADARRGWCDDPRHGAYNRPVRLPFAASHETMVRQDRLYDAVLILDWNYRSRARGRGSAIFVHVARPGLQPTEGCIAFAARDLALILRHLAIGAVFRVAGS